MSSEILSESKRKGKFTMSQMSSSSVFVGDLGLSD